MSETITRTHAAKLHPLAPAVLLCLDRNHDDVVSTGIDAARNGPDGGFGGFCSFAETTAFAMRYRELIVNAIFEELEAAPKRSKAMTGSDILFGKPYMKDYRLVHQLMPLEEHPLKENDIPTRVVKSCFRGDKDGYSDDDEDRYTAVFNGMAWYALEAVGKAILQSMEVSKAVELVTDDVRSIIIRSTIEKNVLKLPDEQLERKCYMDVKLWLEKLGGRWQSGLKGFRFVNDQTDIIALVLEKGNITKDDQYFPTPEEVAMKMMDAIPPEVFHKGMHVLEPSAGRGALVTALLRRWLPKMRKAKVDMLEKNHINMVFLGDICKQPRFEGEEPPELCPFEMDFLDYKNPHAWKYDLIVANPPFAKNADIKNIRHMYDLLMPGGFMVTLASPHWQTSKNKAETAFRDWLFEVGAAVVHIEAGAFQKSGTGIDTRMITIRKGK